VASLIFPGYARIGERALPGLAPVAQAFGARVRGLPQRAALTRALAFIQVIPYDRLEDRANDTGLIPPLAILADNRDFRCGIDGLARRCAKYSRRSR
jgi:hypothetical protein